MGKKSIHRRMVLRRMEMWREALLPPDSIFDSAFMECRSYARWAAEEAINAVKNSAEDTSVSLVVEKLIEEMDRESVRNWRNGYIFSIAHDTLQAMYDEVFLAGTWDTFLYQYEKN